MSTMLYFVFHAVILLVAGINVSSFAVSKNRKLLRSQQELQRIPRRRLQSVRSTTPASSSKQQQQEQLPGVVEFENWFRSFSDDGAWIDENVQHTSFDGGLRGLEWINSNGTDKAVRNNRRRIAVIPAKAVLRTEYTNNDNWDRDLAVKLWKECRLGSRGTMYGYCSLLTCGQDFSTITDKDDAVCPPSTSPHAIRHWTAEQRQILSSSVAGNKLLQFEQTQQKKWRQKYESLDDQSLMSWQQFVWAMEAVYSRAFVGVGQAQSSSSVAVAASIAAPAIASVSGWWYVNHAVNTSDFVLLAFGIMAVLPGLVYNFFMKPSLAATLLPIIDSANHLESADSSIDYDVISNCFQLTVGQKCFVKDNKSKKTQIFVSYGGKKDPELLLNYGFLPDITPSNDSATYRQQLAQLFMQRNSE